MNKRHYQFANCFCPLCDKELKSKPDLLWICPTSVTNYIDSHYSVQSKLTWATQVFIIPPFWFQNHYNQDEENNETFVFKYPYYPDHVVQVAPPWDSMIMKIPRIYPKDVDEKLLKRLQSLVIFS